MAVLTLCIIGWGWYALTHIPVDAIPDISDNQAIVLTEWMGRDPITIEDQITYPLTTTLTGVPGVKVIRSYSGFGFSIIYILFEDGTDFYWARSRVLERLNVAQQWLPAGVAPQLGPDATPLGWIFEYTVEGEGRDLAELRTLQDWFIRYQLQAAYGVSEVASIGGYVKQYQIDVDPNKMRALGVKLADIHRAVERSNIDVGAKVIERSGMEYIVRGVGFVKRLADVENIVVKERGGTPVYVKNLATVSYGPDFRRGALDRAGVEVTGGIVAMRYGENPLRVIEAVKKKIEAIKPGLPEGVRVVPFYDRTTLIQETLGMLRTALSQEMIITVLVIIAFLLHLRSSFVVSVTLPLAVLIAFIAMLHLGIDSNIMSLAGIAIAIGTLVDMGVIMTENIYRHLSEWDGVGSRIEVIHRAAEEVAGAVLTAVATTIVTFIPVFFMVSQEGRLFRPLAWTKTLALFGSVFIAVTLVPVLCNWLLRDIQIRRRVALAISGLLGLATLVAIVFGSPLGWWVALASSLGLAAISYGSLRERLRPIEANPVARAIVRAYEPILRWTLAHKALFLAAPLAITIVGFTIWLGLGAVAWPLEQGLKGLGIDPDQSPVWVSWKRRLPGIGREFMPPLDEGSFLYMPTFLPEASFSEVLEGMKKLDLRMRGVPEVAMVVGKLGRAQTALDPAPVGMIESIVTLKPKSEWRRVKRERWHTGRVGPGRLKGALNVLWPEERPMTKQEILVDLRRVTAMPGAAATWLQPIQTRVVMLQSGLRAMMGAKIFGSDLKEIERIGLQLEQMIKRVPGAVDVVADRIMGKPYIQFDIDREAIARYGLELQDVQNVIETAIGGKNLTWTVEGRERYPVRVRYPRELRDSPQTLARVLVPTPSGAQVPISQMVDIKTIVGPGVIKSENGLLVGYVTFNTRERDEVSVVRDAQRLIAAGVKDGTLKLPKGYFIEWGGQFENQVRASKRLAILLPICLGINFFILYLKFRKVWLTLTVFLAIPVALAGGFLLLAVAGFNLSVAVWVGFIALFGIAVDNGVVMATYLEQTFAARRPATVADVREAVVAAGLKRIRPMLMTTATTILALIPVLASTGRGSDVMKPMAIPSVGGMVVAFVAVSIVPCLYSLVMEWKVRRKE